MQGHQTVPEYTDYIEKYIQNEKGYSLRFRWILGEIEKIRKDKGNLLEIGCAAGFFLKAAEEEGWRTKGVEPVEACARHASVEFNLSVKNDSIEKVDFPDGNFDVIVAFNVLSHLENPTKFFLKIKRLLKDDGIFVFETGNKGAMKTKEKGQILGESWLTPEHLYHFSESSLAILLNKTGFKAKKLTKTHVVDHLLSKRVLSLNRSTKTKWQLKKLLMQFDVARIILASLLKLYFIYLFKADVSALLYVVEKK